MLKIDELKISLMERDLQNKNEEEKHKKAFIIRSSASFDVKDYVTNHIKEKIGDDDYENFISTTSRLIYDELLSKTSHKEVVDTVGVWVSIDSSVYENSMDLDTLDKMEKYGAEDLNAIFELIKMTIP